MRNVLGMALGLTLGAAAPGMAETTDCAAQAAIVMKGVEARVDGQAKGRTKRMLRKELGREAGDGLAEWIYGLPEEQLTEAVGEAWKTQCEAL